MVDGVQCMGAGRMITFEQAVEMALAYDARMNKFAEYENSFEIWWECGVEMMGPQPYVIMRESGERVPFPDAILEGYDRGRLIREGDIPEGMRPSFFTLRDAVYGAAVGDALGVPYEFRSRGTFECAGMASGGAHGQPAGTFSDDSPVIIRANGASPNSPAALLAAAGALVILAMGSLKAFRLRPSLSGVSAGQREQRGAAPGRRAARVQLSAGGLSAAPAPGRREGQGRRCRQGERGRECASQRVARLGRRARSARGGLPRPLGVEVCRNGRGSEGAGGSARAGAVPEARFRSPLPYN